MYKTLCELCNILNDSIADDGEGHVRADAVMLLHGSYPSFQDKVVSQIRIYILNEVVFRNERVLMGGEDVETAKDIQAKQIIIDAFSAGIMSFHKNIKEYQLRV